MNNPENIILRKKSTTENENESVDDGNTIDEKNKKVIYFENYNSVSKRLENKVREHIDKFESKIDKLYTYTELINTLRNLKNASMENGDTITAENLATLYIQNREAAENLCDPSDPEPIIALLRLASSKKIDLDRLLSESADYQEIATGNNKRVS